MKKLIKKFIKPEYQKELLKVIEKAKEYYDSLTAEQQLRVQEIYDGVTAIKVKKKLCITSIEYLFAKVNYDYDCEKIYVEDIDDEDYMKTENEITYYIMSDSKELKEESKIHFCEGGNL